MIKTIRGNIFLLNVLYCLNTIVIAELIQVQLLVGP